MEKLKKIGIDIDDVLCDYAYPFLIWLNETQGVEMPKIVHAFQDVGITDDMFIEFAKSGALTELPLIPHARYGMATLSEYFDIVIVTARAEELADMTAEWFNRYFTPHHIEHTHSKGDYLKSIGAWGLVDDQVKYANQFPRTYVMAQDWNTEWPGKRGNWRELVPIIVTDLKKK